MEWNNMVHMLCRYHSRWTNQMWIDHLHRGSNKKIFQYRLDSDGFILYMHAIQGNSGGNKVDPSRQDNVKILYTWSENIYHVGSSLDPHSIILSGLIAGGKDTKEGRQAVFFTAVNPMTEPQKMNRTT